MYPLVAELADDGIPVVVSCRVLKLARQPYYRWLRHPVTRRELDEAYRANALFDAHRDDPEFGYRLLADEARDEGGEAMSDRTAWRIASANGWWSVFGKKRGKNGKKPGPAVHDDLCVVIDEHGRERHRFVASRPNQLWLTDITEHKTSAGRLYLCAVKDAFSGRIVGYSIDSRMKASLAVRAVRNAVRVRGNVNGCIVHSDRGSQAVFNRSSQHRQREVFDGLQQHAKARARVSRADRLAGQADGRVARGPCPILGRDRRGEENARVRCRCGRVRASRSSLVPECWRRESSTPAQGIRALSLVSRA